MSTSVFYRDPFGNLQTVIGQYLGLEYARAENKVGFLELTLDPSVFDVKLLRLNSRLEPWRAVGARAAVLDGGSVFFLRQWYYEMSTSGQEKLHLIGQDANYLLASRIVAYSAKSAQAERTDNIDDIMRAVVRDNLGANATDAARNLGTSVLTVQADLSLAPSTTRAFSRRNVLTVLQELAQESFQKGTYLAFDVVSTGQTTLEFRVYIGQRGVNHGRASADPVVISQERKNLATAKLTEDYEQEFNYIYAGGQGEKADRVIKTASAAAALGINRRELWVDARQSDAEAAVQSEANAALFENRHRRTLSGKILDTDGCQYGVHYGFGDVVYAEYRDVGFDAHLNAFHVTIADGKETIDSQILAEE